MQKEKKATRQKIFITVLRYLFRFMDWSEGLIPLLEPRYWFFVSLVLFRHYFIESYSCIHFEICRWNVIWKIKKSVFENVMTINNEVIKKFAFHDKSYKFYAFRLNCWLGSYGNNKNSNLLFIQSRVWLIQNNSKMVKNVFISLQLFSLFRR